MSAEILLRIMPDLRSKYCVLVDGKRLGEMDTLKEALIVRDCLAEHEFTVEQARAFQSATGDFVRKLGETIPVDSSALFVLVKSVTEDKVLAEIEPYKPRVLKTSLSNEDEAKLKAALSKAA